MQKPIAFTVAAFTVSLSLIPLASAWTPPPLPQVDKRIFVADTTTADNVQVGAPYNYGYSDNWEWQQVEQVGKWACGLYQRVAVYVSYVPSDVACDQMGAASAERDPNCLHYHTFLCAIPPGQ